MDREEGAASADEVRRNALVFATIQQIEALQLRLGKTELSPNANADLTALARAWLTLGELTGDEDVLRCSVDAHRTAMTEEGAAPHIALADALLTLGQLWDDREALAEAAQTYRTGLDGMPADLHAEDRARAEACRGQALRLLGTRNGDAAVLLEAVSAYTAALRALDGDPHPVRRATTWRDLALTWRNFGGLGGLDGKPGAAFRRAAEASAAAEAELRSCDDVMGVLAAQAERGIALTQLAAACQSRRTAECAAACHRAVGEALPAEAHGSQLWCDNQVALGDACLQLAEMGGSAIEAREAAEAYQAALSRMSPDRDEPIWSRASMNLGSALRHIGELLPDVVALDKAIRIYRNTLDRLAPTRLTDRAGLLVNLGNALRIRGELSGGIDEIVAAAAAYHEALPILAGQPSRLDWATAQMNLGTTNFAMGPELTN